METVRIPYNFEPRDYQLEILSSPAKKKVIVWHRGSGKSVLAINKLIVEAFKTSGVYLYLAPYFSQAKDVVWRNLLFNHIPKGTYKKDESDLTVTLKNGSLIYLRGTDNPDRLRGISDIKGVVYDEAAFMKDLAEIHQKIVEPKALGAFQWFISTPNGQQNYFYDLAHSDIFVSRKTVEDTKVIPQEVLGEVKKSTQEDFYRQEYYCDWIQSASSYFKNVRKIVDENLHLESGDKNGNYYIGVDLASSKDWTVCIAIDKRNNHLVGFERFQGNWTEIKGRVESFIRQYGCSRAYVDATGVGMPPVQDLMDAGLSIEPIKFTNPLKIEFMSKLNIAIQREFFRIPNLPILISELESFIYKLSGTGKLDLQGQNSHDDCVTALALAVYELREKTNEVELPVYAWLYKNVKKDNTIMRL